MKLATANEWNDAISDGVKLHEKVRKWIVSDLVNRNLSAGETYSTEGELVERLCVSRNTVRKAMDSMVSDGYLERRRRVGVVVSEKAVKTLVADLNLSQNRDASATGAGRLVVILPEWDDSTEGFYAGRVLHALTRPDKTFDWVVEIRHPLSVIDTPVSDKTVILAFDPKPEMTNQLSGLAQKGMRIIVNLPAQRLPFAVNINFDIRSAVHDAVRRFTESGHKHVGIINHDTRHNDYRQALDGFLDAHRELKKPIHQDAIIQLWLDEITMPLPNVREVTAWIGTFGKSVDYIAEACRANGLSIPKDVAIVGIDDPGDVIAASVGRKLSVMSQSPDAAANMILKVLSDRSTYRPGSVVTIPMEIIDRETNRP